MNSAVALLVKRQILNKFSADDRSPMVRVTCLQKPEVVEVVRSLRDWSSPIADVEVRVVVTANEVWPGLEPRDVVPRGDETPTTLRNLPGLAVILIEGDDYTDRQSWQNVRPISDSALLDDRAARRDAVEHFFGVKPPELLVNILEEVHKAIRADAADHVDVRHWLLVLRDVCNQLDRDGPLDATSVWNAIGRALPRGRLFPDDGLAGLAPTDRARRLKRNRSDSHHLLFEADDRWRDTLEERAGSTVFLCVDESPEQDPEPIRSAIKKVLGPNGREAQAEVLFRHWLQVTERKKSSKGLGTRIGEHIASTAEQRHSEYERLGVAGGIDAGNGDDAQRLLDDVPRDESLRPLVSLLTNKQVSALERLANPRAKNTKAPLSEILRLVAEMASERTAVGDALEETATTRLLVEPRKTPPEAAHSRALFAWLFGPTLRKVAADVDVGFTSVDVARSLLDPSLLASFERQKKKKKADEEEDDETGAFDTLELRLRWEDGQGAERTFDWNPRDTPGLATLWRLTGRVEVQKWHGADLGFHSWLESAFETSAMLGATSHSDDTSVIASDWFETRGAFLLHLNRTGLESTDIRDYVDRYVATMRELRDDFVPKGMARPEVQQVLDCDLFSDDTGVAVLATHPIRMRWIGTYLDRIQGLLARALRGELITNPVNETLFFTELLEASPQAQPPVAVLEEQLYVAVREQDWHEHLAPLRDEQGERRDWLADLDDGAIDDVGATIAQYLSAYPHKADGLHILYIVRRHGARGLHRLVKNVRSRIKTDGATLQLTLFVEAGEIRAVEEALQDFDDADHRAHSDRPPIQVQLHHWERPNEALPDVSAVPFVDIAVVPNLFGASTRTRDNTRDGEFDSGTFDPLFDQPTRLEAVGAGTDVSTAVSRVLLPEGRDELLELWSTITTRQFRGKPVIDPPNIGDIDHVTIQVSLEKNRAFFHALHDCAHWVVTVDAFVGREQIEALKDGPDVIQVKTGVGANGAYRMVVSSTAGRTFVETRIARRLRQQVASSALPDVARVATTIYDRARLLVPGIVLRSLGLGRTAAEMVGLVIARTRVEELAPARVGTHGFQTWLSLDEHAEWSGGYKSARADMVRLCGRLDGERLYLSIDVVEAKMRSLGAIGRADRQITRSVDLLGSALGHTEAGTDFADAPMWRRLVSRAIEQTSAAKDATPAATHVIQDGELRAGLDDRLRAALRQGEVELESVSGILVSTIPGDVVEDSKTPAGHRWFRMTHDEVRVQLARLCHDSPHPLLESAAVPDVSTDDRPAPDSSTGDIDRVANDGSEDEDTGTLDEVPGGASTAAKRRLQDLFDAFHKRNLDVRPSDEPALEGPGFYSFRVRLAEGDRPQSVFALKEDLQYLLKLDAGRVPRMYVDRGSVVVEVPKREEERYYIDAEDLWTRSEWPTGHLYAPVGSDIRGRSVGVDFSSSRSPHLLIGGMTGGGKSVALETILFGLVRHYSADRLELRVIDPKGNEFTAFEGLDHLPNPPGMDAEDAIELLETTCDEMDQRYRAMKELARSMGRSIRDIATYNEFAENDAAFKWIVVVLDEFADLTADKENKKQIERLLQRIAQKARACGIHAIVATQKPSAEVISTTTRSNLGAQLALRVRSATDSRVIMEATGAETLAGNGDAFLRLSGEEPIRLQCARVANLDSGN